MENNLLFELFLLLIVYQVKHLFADFPLQTAYMLGKFKDGWDFLLPLLAHVGVHGLFTLGIVLYFTGDLLLGSSLACFDIVVHFVMDRIKAGKKYLGRWEPLTAKDYPTASDEEKRHNTYFWWSLGFDQMVHHLTHYAIIACIIFN